LPSINDGDVANENCGNGGDAKDEEDADDDNADDDNGGGDDETDAPSQRVGVAADIHAGRLLTPPPRPGNCLVSLIAAGPRCIPKVSPWLGFADEGGDNGGAKE
jgi:hypothetical protein